MAALHFWPWPTHARHKHRSARARQKKRWPSLSHTGTALAHHPHTEHPCGCSVCGWWALLIIPEHQTTMVLMPCSILKPSVLLSFTKATYTLSDTSHFPYSSFNQCIITNTTIMLFTSPTTPSQPYRDRTCLGALTKKVGFWANMAALSFCHGPSMLDIKIARCEHDEKKRWPSLSHNGTALAHHPHTEHPCGCSVCGRWALLTIPEHQTTMALMP